MIKKLILAFLAALMLSFPAGALELGGIFEGRIGLYDDIDCTVEVLAPKDTRTVYPGKTYYIREKSSGRVFSGTTCYIYANAVFNALFGDVPYHGASDTWLNSSKLHGYAATVSYSSFISWGVVPGSLMRTTPEKDGSYNGGVGHSLIIIEFDSGSITYLEGNGDGKGLIRTATVSWAEFNRRFLTGKGYVLSFIVGPVKSELIGSYRRLREYAGFTDVNEGSWYYTEIREAYELGLVSGTGGGKMTPDGTLTWAQAVTLTARAISAYWGDNESFSGGGRWYEPYYTYLEKWGVKLSRDNCSEMISRSELAGLIYRYFPKNELEKIRENAGFSDASESEAIDSLFEAGIIGGYGGYFRPDDSIKRSEAAVIITRLADRAKRLS